MWHYQNVLLPTLNVNPTDLDLSANQDDVLSKEAEDLQYIVDMMKDKLKVSNRRKNTNFNVNPSVLVTEKTCKGI